MIYIGCAGGRSRFGLRGEIARAMQDHADAKRFRYEVNMQYLSRYRELLMTHVAGHGALPRHNPGERGMCPGGLSPR